MNKTYLYEQSKLPKNFKYPSHFLNIKQDIDNLNLEPWKFLFHSKVESIAYLDSMKQLYKDKVLIPFAIQDDPIGVLNDGFVTIACFDGDDQSGDPKVYFHDYSSKKKVKWDERYFLLNFTEWLRVAKVEAEKFKLDFNN